MNGSELAGERRSAKLMRRVSQGLGPAGVFFQGFLEHPKMVGSIIPSSKSTIGKMLAPVKWDNASCSSSTVPASALSAARCSTGCRVAAS